MSALLGSREDAGRGNAAQEARRDGWLLLRRDGSLWGVRRSSLAELRSGSRLELRDGGSLDVDEVLGLTAELETRALPACARRFGVQGIGGLALFEGEPVLLVDADAPPDCLLPVMDQTVENDAHEGSSHEG